MIYWNDRYTKEKYPNQLNWASAIGSNNTIVSCETSVISGNVTITTSYSGTNQIIWLEDGLPGKVELIASIETNDGRVLATSITFNNKQS